MAIRPIYISTNNLKNPVIQKDISFNWVKGLSYKQKCKRRDSLKEELEKLYDIKEWLEVSTKSDKELGVNLSALNLTLETLYNSITVEQLYQQSKIKNNNNKIIGFKYGSKTYFENTPYGMFYDYIYILALYQNKQYHKELEQYNIFTDIEFNPYKQLNTQARAIAIFKTLYNNDELDIIKDKESFKKYYKENVTLSGLYK